ncbi:hypothetical protein K493DRAFT_314669 [Basidiobolus meristosporus CBS 931.73]|uniref:Uncharacterized protein n=1 Tax=Basidiobolus meristosporus CBS 931.73 TaxID=1314790 RepID=A0A1Y1YDL9_9FUNG|nr:hypothetical protein K493DRAFT_314669 [Basidiobolus meristosporus CBS 931.73]|eukprot:ORX96087.1 hypothetical protein K493DRAFT_314669 [Basidiobolus meristosporus CBS 931.73]
MVSPYAPIPYSSTLPSYDQSKQAKLPTAQVSTTNVEGIFEALEGFECITFKTTTTSVKPEFPTTSKHPSQSNSTMLDFYRFLPNIVDLKFQRSSTFASTSPDQDQSLDCHYDYESVKFASKDFSKESCFSELDRLFMLLPSAHSLSFRK